VPTITEKYFIIKQSTSTYTSVGIADYTSADHKQTPRNSTVYSVKMSLEKFKFIEGIFREILAS
jgi:hypothetical protein